MINKGEALLVDRSPIAKLSLLTAKLTLTAVKASAKGVATLPTEAHLLPKAAALVEAPSTSSSTAERSGAKAIATAKASTETITTDQVATTEASTVRRKAASAGSESVVGVSEARRSRGAGHSSNPSLRADDVRLLRYRGRRVALDRPIAVAAGVAAGRPRRVVGAGVTAPGPTPGPATPGPAPAATLVEEPTTVVSELATTVDGTADGNWDELRHLHGDGDGDLLDFLDMAVVVVLPAFIVGFGCGLIGVES